MIFIKLKQENGKEVFVNASNISTMERHDPKIETLAYTERTEAYTTIMLNDNIIYVKETPSEIFSKIDREADPCFS